MKKVVAMVLSLVLALGLMAGCGQSEEPAEADLMAMAERPEFAAMPRYPDDGSVQIIDGCLVVKVQEEYTPKSDFEIAYENRR